MNFTASDSWRSYEIRPFQHIQISGMIFLILYNYDKSWSEEDRSVLQNEINKLVG